MLKTWERRQDLRHDRPFVAFLRAQDTTFRRTVALDLSASGARLSSEQALHSGQMVTVNLRVENQRLVSFQAQVQWSRSVGASFEAGVRFVGGCRADTQWLDSWAHRHELLLVS